MGKNIGHGHLAQKKCAKYSTPTTVGALKCFFAYWDHGTWPIRGGPRRQVPFCWPWWIVCAQTMGSLLRCRPSCQSGLCDKNEVLREWKGTGGRRLDVQVLHQGHELPVLPYLWMWQTSSKRLQA